MISWTLSQKEAPVFGYPHIIIFQVNCILLPHHVDGSTLISNPVGHSVPSVATAFWYCFPF